MPANSWPEHNTDHGNSDSLDLILPDLSENKESEYLQPKRFQGRRGKAALILTIVWSGTITLHLVSWGSIFILGLTTILGIHALGIIFTKRRDYSPIIEADLPFVSVLVAAKNEEAVIGRLVKNLCNLEYGTG
ncbi:MAG: glycosyltransferase, partial [Dolichospermum sp.]